MSDPRSPRVRSAEETILDLHAKIESDAKVIAALIERLRSFGPDWTKKITGSIAPYEVCANAADRIESDAKVIAALRNALEMSRTEMADHLIPFTEQEVADLMEAIDFAIEASVHDSEWQRWAVLYRRLKSYND